VVHGIAHTFASLTAVTTPHRLTYSPSHPPALREGWLPLFTELPRRRVFSETGLPVYTVLGNSSAKRA
jgi:hypothetical protein